MLLVILNVKKLLECSLRKRIAKIKPKRAKSCKSDKLYVKWKGYDSSFISWIDKKINSEYFP